MKLFDNPRRWKKIMLALFGAAGAVGALWWAVFALKPYDITPAQWEALYAHASASAPAPQVQLGAPEPVTIGATPAWAQSIRYAGFDGATVLGRLVHPADPAQPAAAATQRPVLVALHAMGRTHRRWWQPDIQGRPTIEGTHLVAEQALQAGHVVLALDARLHGDRKDPARPLIARQLLRDLHLWGEREPYERLIVDTVKDYRTLLDWVVQQPWADHTRIRAAGYSMGAQMALLLAAADGRVRSVAAMVPPHLGRTVAAVAPSIVAHRLAGVDIWLLTAEDDEHASQQDNRALFTALPGPAKRHLTFPGGHVLPAAYVQALQPWLARQPQAATAPHADRGPAASLSTRAPGRPADRPGAEASVAP
ncbi:alpha/beta hydrolase family protein [Rubrivivax sp. RP6-9]|uniref:alpha/beta hydrolase family protein n=1 Tax=Rubrivivax sp. RP6-9 TaxID=3415750 RepID=UPI003CC50BFF